MRAMRVFRDKTGLSVTPELWTSIQTALGDSEYFVLLASPGAAESYWVQKEIDYWITHQPPKNLLVILTSGEIVWDIAANDFDWEKTTALPKTIRGKLSEEPLWVDARWANKSEKLDSRNPSFCELVADLSSTLRAIPKDQLIGEDVHQHRKAVRIRRGAISVLAALALGLALATIVAFGQKTLADRNRDAALKNAQQANDNAKEASDNLITATNNEAEACTNADRAVQNRFEAEENLKLAVANEARARENQKRAEENAAEARRQSDRALARQLAAQSQLLGEQRGSVLI
jgi:aminopeptidase N